MIQCETYLRAALTTLTIGMTFDVVRTLETLANLRIEHHICIALRFKLADKEAVTPWKRSPQLM